MQAADLERLTKLSLLDELPADESTAQAQESLVDVVPPLARTCGGAGVADSQAAEAVEPGQGALSNGYGRGK